MHLLTGINHVAILTSDLDRFVEFYTTIFDVPVVSVPVDCDAIAKQYPINDPIESEAGSGCSIGTSRSRSETGSLLAVAFGTACAVLATRLRRLRA